MKLYLSQGTIWTGTQADAKAAQGGPNFQTIEVPTDKPGLMAWLNERYGNAVVSDEPEEAAVETEDELSPPVPSMTPSKHVGAVAPNGERFCATCGRTETGHHWLVQGDIQDAIIDGINKLDQGFALNNVAVALEARGDELGL